MVGGGMAGLSAALSLTDADPPPAVVLLEADGRLGGKIRTEAFAGRHVDTGPDAFLARVPDAIELCRRLGLADELVAPATGRAFLWVRGALRPLPEGLALGVPTRLGPLARSGILSPLGVARVALDLVLPGRPPPGDRSVGDLVRPRLGAQAYQRLVDPLVGGIHAGRADRLSAAAAAPRLDLAARRSASLIRGLRSGADGGGAGPVFLTHPQGLTRVVERLDEELAARGVARWTGTTVRALDPGGGAWTLDTTTGPVVADAVVLALPAPGAAGLLAPHAPGAAGVLGAIAHAGVSVVTLAYPTTALPHPLEGSGFLVPATEGRLTTACTWSSAKWPHLGGDDRVLLRASTGRLGDERHAELDEEALVARVHGEVAEALGLAAAGPELWRVTRWPGAFPQYAPGHHEALRGVEAGLEALPPLALAGAAYQGIGIPACIAGGARAANRVLEALRRGAPAGGGG
ncbi:MAG TPA: protoporphyrinogen oxidase [Acidimicrobiales bacterium]|nr:protoporphyrinogen oxidase [Acidimicrobiales bacterium]